MKLADKTYFDLRDDIFNARYKPNELITERQIAEKYGVSKLTAGSALHRLCAEGHLTSYPRSGYMVRVLSREEVDQLTKVRVALESLAVKTVCEEASGDQIRSLRTLIVENPLGVENPNELNAAFHMGIAELSGNEFLVTILRDILGSLSRVEQHFSDQSARENWQEYHRQIVDALLARDEKGAVAALEKDLGRL